MVSKVYPALFVLTTLACGSGSGTTSGIEQGTGGSFQAITTTGGSSSTGGSLARGIGGVTAATGGASSGTGGCASGFVPTIGTEDALTIGDDCTQFTSISPRTICVGSNGISVVAGPCSTDNVFAKCESDNYYSNGDTGTLVVYWYNNSAYTLNVVQAACTAVAGTLTVM